MVGPLGEDLLRRLVEEADVCIGLCLLTTFTACLQVKGCLVQCAKRIPDVLSCLGCNTHILSQSAHLLVKVDVAFLSLIGNLDDFATELVPDLIDLLNA